jgi:hypothetical protein
MTRHHPPAAGSPEGRGSRAASTGRLRALATEFCHPNARWVDSSSAVYSAGPTNARPKAGHWRQTGAAVRSQSRRCGFLAQKTGRPDTVKSPWPTTDKTSSTIHGKTCTTDTPSDREPNRRNKRTCHRARPLGCIQAWIRNPEMSVSTYKKSNLPGVSRLAHRRRPMASRPADSHGFPFPCNCPRAAPRLRNTAFAGPIRA